MSRRVAPVVILVCILAGAVFSQSQRTAKVLVLVGGLYHDYDNLPRVATQRLHEQLKSKVDVSFTITTDVAALRAEELSKYNALMINVCEQTPVTPEERQGLLEAVRNGLPVVALHCTFWSFQDWPEFKKMLGAFVPGHGHFGTFCLKRSSSDPQLLPGIPDRFELTDEPYIVNERDPADNVLINTCESVQGRPGTEPEVWTKVYEKGRIFAMTFGHDSQAQDDPNYQKLLADGLLWALGRTEN